MREIPSPLDPLEVVRSAHNTAEVTIDWLHQWHGLTGPSANHAKDVLGKAFDQIYAMIYAL